MRVFLDSCVILSSTAREIIFELSRNGYFELAYSASIEAETKHVAERKGIWPSIAPAFVTLRLFCEPVNEGETPDFWLPDEGDKHVLAGAILAKADILLSENLRDFPRAALEPFGLRALSPDQWIAEIWDQFPEQIEEIFSKQSEMNVSILKKSKLFLTAKRYKNI